MRLLVTGGSGFLGSHLVRSAKDRHETFATFFSRPVAGALALDVRDAIAVRHLVGSVRPECIIHTAYDRAGTGWQAVITEGSGNIARAAKDHGARLIHLSTDVVFDGERGWYREEDTPNPVTEYGLMKYKAEQIVADILPAAVLVRTSLVYEPAGRDPHSMLIVRGACGGTPVTLFVDEYRCPVSVSDVTSALLELTDMGIGGPLHVAGAERISRYDFGLLLAGFHSCAPENLVATTAAALGMVRPKDCSLDISKAQKILHTRLRGVSEVLQRGQRHETHTD